MQYRVDNRRNFIIEATPWERGLLVLIEKEKGIVYAEEFVIDMLKDINPNIRKMSPLENMDLTEATIITDGVMDWWDERYQIDSFVDRLVERGEATLEFGRLSNAVDSDHENEQI
jgi:hypothetical protein